jgi:hypothetical protein
VAGDAGGRCAYWALWLLDVAVTCVVPAFLLPASCYRHCGPWEPWESWGSLGNCQPLLPRLPFFASCRARYFKSVFLTGSGRRMKIYFSSLREKRVMPCVLSFKMRERVGSRNNIQLSVCFSIIIIKSTPLIMEVRGLSYFL